MDTEVFYFFYNLSKIPWVKDTASFVSNVLPYLLVFVLIYFVLFKANRKIFAFSFLFLTSILTLFLANLIKSLVARDRPFISLDFIPLYIEQTKSFPSAHTALFFSLASVLVFIDKRMSLFFFFCAILIGISRMVLGVHYPVDVLGGMILGVFVGLLLSKVFRKI